MLLSLSPLVAPSGAGTTTTTPRNAVTGSGPVVTNTPVPVAGVDAFGIGVGQLDFPQGLAFDNKGDLFVASPGNSQVLESTSSSGGWDLDDNSNWYAPISSAYTYSAAIWVRATAAVSVDIGVDLLTSNGTYVDTASGPWVALAANTWTELTVSGIKPTSTEVYAGMEPDFSKAVKGTVIYWDDMDLTS